MKFSDLEPVAIVLDHIETGKTMRFSGTDLESGHPMVVAVDCPAPCHGTAAGSTHKVNDLLLILTIQSIDI